MKVDWMYLEPFDAGEIARIYGQFRLAEHSKSVRCELLERLGFVPEEFGAGLIESMTKRLRLEVILMLSLLLIFCHEQSFATWVISIYLAFVAYDRWMKSQRDRNVDDALRRKDRTNQLITQNAGLLLRYVGNVFDLGMFAWQPPLGLEDQIKVEMFVFSELDNLEFVFDKSRARLIETEYTMRALKIFIARAENSHFERVARRLVITGRYNIEFIACVNKLLSLGSWVRFRNPGPV
jgi:hypothetical protein